MEAFPALETNRRCAKSAKLQPEVTHKTQSTVNYRSPAWNKYHVQPAITIKTQPGIYAKSQKALTVQHLQHFPVGNISLGSNVYTEMTKQSFHQIPELELHQLMGEKDKKISTHERKNSP